MKTEKRKEVKRRKVVESESEWRERIEGRMEERMDRLEEVLRNGFDRVVEELMGVRCSLDEEVEVGVGEDVEMEVV